MKENADVALGGTAPLLRLSDGGCCPDCFQLDFFGVTFARLGEYRTLEAADFRFGFPLTWARGPWQAKLAYEHTSCQLGDEFIALNPGYGSQRHIREDIVAGLAYRFGNQLRVYGQFGYAASLTTVGPPRGDRYDVGLEWSKQVATGLRGQLFAAVDLDIRGEEDYTPNVSVQVGWQWLEVGSLVSSLRLALEYYDDRSPFGQFFQQHEQWVGVGLHLDF
jgi:hypothetical protein